MQIFFTRKQAIACRRRLLLIASLALFDVRCRRRREQNQKTKPLKHSALKGAHFFKALYERSNDQCLPSKILLKFVSETLS